MRNGLDFSGAIYSLDTGNQVFVPAFAAGRRVRHRRVHRVPRRGAGARPDHVPGAAVGRPDRLDALRRRTSATAQPMPLDGRGLMRRMLGRAGRRRLRLPGRHRGRVLHRQARRRPRSCPENAGFTPPPPAGQRVGARLPVPVRGAAGQRDRHPRGDQGRPVPRSGCRRGRWRTSGAPARWSSASARSAGWRPPTPWCCSAPRSSRCASAAGCWRRFMCRPGAAELLLLRLAPARVAGLPPGRAATRSPAPDDGLSADRAGSSWPA